MFAPFPPSREALTGESPHASRRTPHAALYLRSSHSAVIALRSGSGVNRASIYLQCIPTVVPCGTHYRVGG